MKKSVAAAALATVLAAPASAQSFDPSVGSGNIAGRGDYPLSAHAREVPTPTGRRPAPQAVQPFSAAEKALFDRITIE